MRYYRFGQDAEQPAPASSATSPTAAPSSSTAALDWRGALVAGAIMGLSVYGVARAVEVEKQKSLGLATTMGLVTMIGQVATGWLQAKAQDALRLAGGK